MKHFKLRKDLSIEYYDPSSGRGVTLYRIKALKNILGREVKKGDIGGFVESEDNLCDNAWVFDNAKVFGNARVYGDSRVSGNSMVHGNAQVCGYASVFGDAQVYGDAWVYEHAVVYGDACVYGNARVCGYARVPIGSLQHKGDGVNISGGRYIVTILPKHIKIGCQCHTREEWWNFTDKEILEMDGKEGLKWWKTWKPKLQSLCN